MHRHDAHAAASSLMQMTSVSDFALVQEELAAGLHLIDFEQLKIENQSLNEKIEERNEELLKLRRKTTSTVQVGAMVIGPASCFIRSCLVSKHLAGGAYLCRRRTCSVESTGSNAAAVGGEMTAVPLMSIMLPLLRPCLHSKFFCNIASLLQVLTHVKEKLQYIEKENEALQVSASACLVSTHLSVSPVPAE